MAVLLEAFTNLFFAKAGGKVRCEGSVHNLQRIAPLLISRQAGYREKADAFSMGSIVGWSATATIP